MSEPSIVSAEATVAKVSSSSLFVTSPTCQSGLAQWHWQLHHQVSGQPAYLLGGYRADATAVQQYTPAM
jgi:hypothetical protein